MGVLVYMDAILVPLSLFLVVAYHVYLWHCFKNNPTQTTIGINASRRKSWLLHMEEGDDKKGMLAVQSLRNAQMTTIVTASIAILVNTSLAALINNTYNSSHLFSSSDLFGSQSGRICILKFGSASLFLLFSFLCSSMGLGLLVDANFLITTPDDDHWSSSPSSSSSFPQRQLIIERGFMLALIGNRLLSITFPLLIWMFGPLPAAISSVAIVLVLHEHDFCSKFSTRNPACSRLDLQVE